MTRPTERLILRPKSDQLDRPAPLHHGDLQRIGGLPAVSALFQRAPERVERLFFEPRMAGQVHNFCQMMAKARKPYRQVSAEELTKIGGSPLHGGVVAVAYPKHPLPLDMADFAAWSAAKQSVIILDGVGNPHNLGAIARTMAFFGFGKLILSNHPEQASLSGAAQRVAEGGLEWIDVYTGGNMTALVTGLCPHYTVIGTALGTYESPKKAFQKTAKPIALLFGNEEIGLPTSTLKACDTVVTIQGRGQIQSLNVSNSAAILLHALADSQV